METNTENIIAYLEGKLSVQEQQELENLIQSSASLRKEVEDYRFLLQITTELKQRENVDTDRNWKQLSRRIAFTRAKIKFIHFIRTSAAILFIPLLIGSCFLWYQMNVWQNIPIEQIELSTAYGLVSKITLPDGSEVWLNSGTHISYPKEFRGERRTVTLSGEAYFKVAADKENRFDVLTPNGIIVSAYGTEFNVSAYEDEPKIEAVLVSGHIEVSDENKDNKSSFPNARQAVVYTKDTDEMHIENTNILVKTSWKDGKMVFRRTNFQEIARQLSRKFNVDVRLEGKDLYEYDYTATFTTETLEEIISLLEKSAPIKCKVIEPEVEEDLSFSQRIVIIRKR